MLLPLVLLLVQTAGHDEWKPWLDQQAGDFSGVALVARGDTVDVVSAYGLSDRAAQRRNTPETRFNLGWDPLESTCRHASLSIL